LAAACGSACAASITPDALMDWAEVNYPQFFSPVHQATQTFGPYTYRYYPATLNYLGVAGQEVYVLGPMSGNEITRVGNVADVACNVTPQSCSTAGTSSTLTVSVGGNGSVSSNPAGLDCWTACSASFNTGSSVTLTATPAAGYVFVGWGGSCSGLGACALTMGSAQNVSAQFKTGSPVTIKWAAPVSMGNGTALSGLVGYKVYASRTRQDLNPVLVTTIADAAATGATVSLASGTWYFSVTAYTPNAESDPVYYPAVVLP